MNKVQAKLRDPVLISCILMSCLMVCLAILGAVRSFSPVPYWDMWDAGIDFYLNKFNWAAWWVHHNEHRIFISRILIWLDIFLFGGKSILLIIANYIFLAATAILIINMYNEAVPKESTRNKLIISSVIIGFLFSWEQSENLIKGFQVCFFIVNFLALLSFYFLHRSINEKGLTFYAGSVTAAFTASFVLANGVFIMPLVAINSIFILTTRGRRFFLFVASLLVLLIFFQGYVSPSHHGSFLNSLSTNPFGLMQYVSLYIGAPFYYLLGAGQVGWQVAIIAGLLIIYFVISNSKSVFSKHELNSLQIALYFFSLYVIVTAIVTAGGRLNLGVDQALASRYTSITILGAIVAFVFQVSRKAEPKPVYISSFCTDAICFVFLALLLFFQGNALIIPEFKHESLLAGLALELGVNDTQQLKKVYPDPARLIMLAQRAKQSDISIFSSAPLKGSEGSLQKTITDYPKGKCIGNIDGIGDLPEDMRYSRFTGWIFDAEKKTSPNFITITDMRGEIVGYAVGGKIRIDVAATIHPKANLSGFDGYILKNRKSDEFMMIEKGNCVYNWPSQ